MCGGSCVADCPVAVRPRAERRQSDAGYRPLDAACDEGPDDPADASGGGRDRIISRRRADTP